MVTSELYFLPSDFCLLNIDFYFLTEESVKNDQTNYSMRDGGGESVACEFGNGGGRFDGKICPEIERLCLVGVWGSG